MESRFVRALRDSMAHKVEPVGVLTTLEPKNTEEMHTWGMVRLCREDLLKDRFGGIRVATA